MAWRATQLPGGTGRLRQRLLLGGIRDLLGQEGGTRGWVPAATLSGRRKAPPGTLESERCPAQERLLAEGREGLEMTGLLAKPSSEGKLGPGHHTLGSCCHLVADLATQTLCPPPFSGHHPTPGSARGSSLTAQRGSSCVEGKTRCDAVPVTPRG